jgi:hypothetical protein
MDRADKEQRLAELRAEVELLENELASEAPPDEWAPKGYYFTYDVLAGAVLGLFGAAISLLFNIVGSLLIDPPADLDQHPLNLIRVYLTFPLKETALTTDSGLALAVGCCLYLGTGMILGIPFQMAQTLLLKRGSFASRLALNTGLAILLWLINFYGILSWLQPVLFGGRWIVDLIPWWVAMSTHLVFGWTMAIVYPLGVFHPYRRVGEQE